MKIKLENLENNTYTVLCKRKKQNLIIQYVDVDTGEIITKETIKDLDLGKEHDIELTIPDNYEIFIEEQVKEIEKEESYEEKVLKEMKKMMDSLQ